MEFTIRRAGEDDFPAILALINELAEYERSPDAVTNTVEQMHREKDHFRCFVAESPEHVILGMALYFSPISHGWENRFTSKILSSAGNTGVLK